MSKREWKTLIEDIIDSIEKIKSYTQNINDFDDFAINSIVIDAVVRNIEIIGEASKNVPVWIKEKFPTIPWIKLAGIRNRIVHEYFGIDLSIIWYIVTNEIAPLKTDLQKMLEEDGI